VHGIFTCKRLLRARFIQLTVIERRLRGIIVRGDSDLMEGRFRQCQTAQRMRGFAFERAGLVVLMMRQSRTQAYNGTTPRGAVRYNYLYLL